MSGSTDPLEQYLEIDGEYHKCGDSDCDECWPGYPISCECGGLMHSAFGDTNYDDDYWLYTKCDKCGESER